jgi:hypothetical protein
VPSAASGAAASSSSAAAHLTVLVFALPVLLLPLLLLALRDTRPMHRQREGGEKSGVRERDERKTSQECV